MVYKISKKDQAVKGIIRLDGSKSISNRVLIIRALCEDHFDIQNLSTSDDTKAMQRALQSDDSLIDVGAAGTTMRFLTAYTATTTGNWTLTGSARMKQRPIGVLVDALRTLDADISYLEKEGYPPMQTQGKQLQGGAVSMKANVSSQYLSALLMIAPTLAKGLQLTLDGNLVSRPYLMMTLRIMEYFGVQHSWEEDTINIPPQKYTAKSFFVEADWSAASYYYAMAAFSNDVDLHLHGLSSNSLQGDSVLASMMTEFGVQTTFTEKGVHLTKSGIVTTQFNFDFIECPDLAQTIAVVCGGLGVPANFKGLITLSIKETDRTAALRNELAKFGVIFEGNGGEWSVVIPEINNDTPKTDDLPTIATYHDHRMAMAFAPIALPKGDILIVEPMVVTKSYPNYYEAIATLGYEFNRVEIG